MSYDFRLNWCFALLAAGLLPAVDAHAQGAFSAPVQNSFTIDFADSLASAPGAVEFVGDGFAGDYDDSIVGEGAFWGSFGGGPDSITVEVLEDVGPNGVGDNAVRLTVADTTPGGYFAGLRFAAKGLRLGNSGGATASGDEPIPDMDAGLVVTAPVRTNITDARFRINFDTGSTGSSVRYDDPDNPGETLSFVRGNFPGLIDNFGPGSRVLKLGPATSDTQEIGSLPINTWGTQADVGGLPVAAGENPSSLNGWNNANFGPFFFRSPRSFDLTRVGVTFPGGGNPGEVLLSEWTLTGPDVLKYHMADFNTDEMVDAADIDLLAEAINVLAVNEALPEVPDNNFNGQGDFVPEFGVNRIPGLDSTLPEKFALNPTDADLDGIDLAFLVEDILGTAFGDVDLDGDVDNDDLAAAQANVGMDGGWAMGDMDGDADVDTDDIAIINAALGGGGLPGDANGDGSVDLLDLDILGANFGTMGTGTVATGDFNNDTNIDLLDLDILGANFGSMASSAIPEPTAAVAAAMAVLMSVARPRRS
ncbi:MAG: hypothetical protein AAF266_01810 [Planctomycetota bacterium]